MSQSLHISFKVVLTYCRKVVVLKIQNQLFFFFKTSSVSAVAESFHGFGRLNPSPSDGQEHFFFFVESSLTFIRPLLYSWMRRLYRSCLYGGAAASHKDRKQLPWLWPKTRPNFHLGTSKELGRATGTSMQCCHLDWLLSSDWTKSGSIMLDVTETGINTNAHPTVQIA